MALQDAMIQALETQIGADRVVAWDALPPTQQATLSSAIAPKHAPIALVTPHTPEELQATITLAQEHRWRILPCGNGSKLGWGGLLRPDTDPIVALSTAKLDRLIDHAVGDLTVTVEAGMPMAKLQSLLGQSGQFLAIDPSFPDRATLGGIVATGDTGALRHRYNSVRDMLLGIEFVRSDGQLVKAGGRVVKNVAGYDLMKLLTGSYGTLGVITQVTLRVYPQTETSQTVLLRGAPAPLGNAAQTLLSSALTPVAIDLLSAGGLGAIGEASSGEMGLLVRFQSIAASVDAQSQHCVDLGEKFGLQTKVYSAATEATLWTQLAERMAGDATAAAITAKIGVRASEAVKLLQAIEALGKDTLARIHLGSGLGQLVTSAEMRSTQLLELRQRCRESHGFLTVLRAPLALKQSLDVWGDVGSGLAPMQAIKQQFDPRSIFSPGRFVGGI